MITLTIMCLMLVAAADVLFYRQPIGLTPGIFAALLTLAILTCRSRALSQWPGRLIVLGIAGLCLALVEHPGPLRISLTMIGIGALACTTANGWTPSVIAWMARGSELFARCFFQLPLDLIARSRWLQRYARHDSGLKFLINWAVPVLLTLLFVVLFTVANPIISRWFSMLGDSLKSFFTDLGDYVSIARVGLWLVVGFFAWAHLRGRGRGLVTGARAEALIFAPRRYAHEASHTPLIVRCLLLFNLVFAVQMVLDLTTVFSHGATLPVGMTYSHYAHRGAYPLVATALLAAAFVLVSFPTGLDATATNRMQWARRLVYLWIAQNILLVCSAAWRLGMYIEAFGLTRLRIAAGIWMLLVALGLGWIVWRIVRHRTNSWLLRVNTITTITVLYLCCFANFDSMIAWHNVRHCNEVDGDGPKADLAYLKSLGPESIPAFVWLGRKQPDQPIGGQSIKAASDLRADLNEDLETWQGWTLRRSRLAEHVIP